MILFDHVKKCYGTHTALEDFSLHIPKGQIVGLLGQNGAGKSTAMNILCGCLKATEGKVTVDGLDMEEAPLQFKRRIGYLPETAPLYDEMTVENYLAFICRMRKVKEKDIPGEVRAVCDKTHLSDVMGRRIGNLSRGFRQRTAFAQALCASPRVIVLDEPTQGLDPVQAVEFRQLITSLRGEHTVLFSSHILADISKVCDRAVILHEGTIRADEMLKDQNACTVRLHVLLGEGKCLSALSSLPGAEKVTPLKDHPRGECHVLIKAKSGHMIEQEIFTLMCALNAPILHLSRVRDTLEDLFLHVTR